MNKVKFYSLSGIAAVMVAAGCGGSSSIAPAHPATGTLGFTGVTTVTTSPTAPATVPATGGVTITTSDTGTGGTAIIPSGAVPAGTTVDSSTILAVLPAGLGFPGNFGTDAQMSVNGVSNSGVSVSRGTTSLNVALPVDPVNGTSYKFSFPQGDIDNAIRMHPNTLTIHSTSFTGRYYIVRINGRPVVVSPVPVDLGGRIPNNGQNAVNSAVIASFGPGNDGRKATIFIDYGNGFSLNQTQVIASNRVTFRNLATDAANVPSGGIALLSLVVGDLP